MPRLQLQTATHPSLPELFHVPMHLETPSFVLRPYHSQDAPLMQDALCCSHTHLKPWLGDVPADPSLMDCVTKARLLRSRYIQRTDFTLAVLSPDEDRLLGEAGYHLRQGSVHVRQAELGVWIRAEEANRGLGTQVLRALLSWGFSHWPWERLIWGCHRRNLASVRLASKVGMRRESFPEQWWLSASQLQAHTRGPRKVKEGLKVSRALARFGARSLRDPIAWFSVLRPEWHAIDAASDYSSNKMARI